MYYTSSNHSLLEHIVQSTHFVDLVKQKKKTHLFHHEQMNPLLLYKKTQFFLINENGGEWMYLINYFNLCDHE